MDIALREPAVQNTHPYLPCHHFLLANVNPGMRVLDVGCGNGDLMAELASHGVLVQGIEVEQSLVQSCQTLGLAVQEGRAEELPFPNDSLDTIVCSVVVPYTDERQAVREWARVLKAGGSVNATYHGVGYALRYLFLKRGKNSVYGLRMLANTLYYGLTGRRLPSFLGDTLCQTSHRMRSYYKACGLTLEQEQVVGAFMGFPIHMCHRVVKGPPSA